MLKWVSGGNLEKLVLQTPLGVSSSTTVLKRVLIFNFICFVNIQSI